MGPIDAKTRPLSVLEPIELHLLPAEGLRFDEAVPVAWLSRALGETTDTGEPIVVLGEGHATIEVTPLGEVSERPPIRISGRIHGRARTACVRCLEDVDLDVGDSIETTLFASEAPAPSGPGKKKRGPDKSDEKLEDWTNEEMPDLSALDEAGYVGERIDVPAVLQEAVMLSMDLNPTCADTGACDSRTQAMLDEANRPAREAEGGPDPRWAALANLVTKESDEDS